MNFELSRDETNPTDLSEAQFENITLLQVRAENDTLNLESCIVVFFNQNTGKDVEREFEKPEATGEYLQPHILVTKRPIIDLTLLPSCYVKDIVWGEDTEDDENILTLALQ